MLVKRLPKHLRLRLSEHPWRHRAVKLLLSRRIDSWLLIVEARDWVVRLLLQLLLLKLRLIVEQRVAATLRRLVKRVQAVVGSLLARLAAVHVEVR